MGFTWDPQWDRNGRILGWEKKSEKSNRESHSESKRGAGKANELAKLLGTVDL